MLDGTGWSQCQHWSPCLSRGPGLTHKSSGESCKLFFEQLVIVYCILLKVDYYFINVLFYSSYTREPFPITAGTVRVTRWIVVKELWCREEDSPGNLPQHHTSVKSHKPTHTKLTPIHASSVQTQWFIYIKGMTQNRVLISMQNVPKTSNGRLWGGRERSHIKGISRRHNLDSTWAIFHLNHIAQHLVFNTLILRRLLLLQLACSLFHNVTNSITSTAVHEDLVSPSPLSLTCLLSFSC